MSKGFALALADVMADEGKEMLGDALKAHGFGVGRLQLGEAFADGLLLPLPVGNEGLAAFALQNQRMEDICLEMQKRLDAMGRFVEVSLAPGVPPRCRPQACGADEGCVFLAV